MDYQSNSDKSKRLQAKNIEKIVTGEVIERPKPVGRKFKEVFFGGTFKAAATYVGADVLLPALRNLLWDMLSKGSERVIFGDSTYRRRAPEYRSRIQYDRSPLNPMIREPRERVYLPDQPPYAPLRQNFREPNDIILSTRAEAEAVIEMLISIIEQYDVATLADLKDLLGLSTEHTDNKFGWTSLGKVEIRQVREGYAIDLPRLKEI